MKAMTALKTYALGQLSSRQAGALAGVSRGECLQLLRAHQIHPFERLDDTGASTPPIPEWSDALVLKYATMQMPAWQSRRLQELLEQQRAGQLSTEEQGELTALSDLHDRALLLKSEAIAEAVRRSLSEAGSEV